jgi:hypothetical protein
MSVYGPTGATGYVGMTGIGRPQPGETVLPGLLRQNDAKLVVTGFFESFGPGTFAEMLAGYDK